MTGTYWQRVPEMPAREGRVHVELSDLSLSLRTSSGVFGAQRVDRGTIVLLRNAPAPAAGTGVVDVGTGYGPIAVVMGLRQPDAGVWAVDVNRRAIDLARFNANAAGATNVHVAEPVDVPAALRFARLYSNPPVKIGRDAMNELLRDWVGRLSRGADAYLVVKQSMGADRLQRWLNDAGHPTRRAASKQGYRLLHTKVGSEPAKDSDAMTLHDLSVLNKTTGRRWSVLGTLAGGVTDSVHLLGSGRHRAVVKIKRGPGWAAQLGRTAAIVTALRSVGYPTPAVIGFGALDGERHYLATEFSLGSQPVVMDEALTRDVLTAVEMHADVHPPETRDWSAMITMFLNGGLSEHEFHPSIAGRAARALGLLTRPIPALPTGEFVHGDFSTRNLLAHRGRLDAVIDIEGFGRGSRTIDLVALLAGSPSKTAADERIKEEAIAASDQSTFLACLAHRVLATLLAVSEGSAQAAVAIQRADALLALAG
jgi:aminoglycoside phosphotransferase